MRREFWPLERHRLGFVVPNEALEPEVIELVHYFKISDRHARMLNEQLKRPGRVVGSTFRALWPCCRRRNNTYEEDIAALYEILKGAKNPGATGVVLYSSKPAANKSSGCSKVMDAVWSY